MLSSNHLFQLVRRKSDQLAVLRQEWLLDDGKFNDYCRDRAVETPTFGSGIAAGWWRQGWLRADQILLQAARVEDRYEYLPEELRDDRAMGDPWRTRIRNSRDRLELKFHPFRFAVARVINPRVRFTNPVQHFEKGHIARYAIQPSSWKPDLISEVDFWNGVADLATLLEPLYWPRITGVLRGPRGIKVNREEAGQLYDEYREEMLDWLRSHDAKQLEDDHQKIVWEAYREDSNDQLYLILRTSKWEFRNRLKGTVASSLALRHIAEVIRRGIEEAHGVELPEEDRTHGGGFEWIRVRDYRTNRPLDFPPKYKKHILKEVGLDSSIQTRWYVEGDTEKGAIIEACYGDPTAHAIEIVNLKGVVAARGKNLLLQQLIEADLAAERFSFISADFDVPENADELRRLARQKDFLVGWTAAHDPDFEFANFDLEELVSIASEFDPALDQTGREKVRAADWSGIRNAASFDKRYQEIALARSLKGLDWGRALMRYARQHQIRPSTKSERPVVVAVRMALRSKIVDHQRQKDWHFVDPESFTVKEKKNAPFAE